MKRHAKSLQKKARTHQVELNHDGTFTVISGSSGERYTVYALQDGSLRCVCEWSKWRAKENCSHRLQVLQWCETAGMRRLSFWETEKDARRQRRPFWRLESGLWATSRKTAEAARAVKLTAAQAAAELFD